MNLKTLSLSLVLSSLGVLAISSQAQAYSLTFLGLSSAGGGLTNYDFRFTLDGGQTFTPGSTLTLGSPVNGFSGISSGAALTRTLHPDAPSGDTLSASNGFTYVNATNGNTIANFSFPNTTATAFPDPLNFQTFRVTAVSVPNGQIDWSFNVPGGPSGGGTTPIPEPLTVLGSLAALGVGTRCKKEFDKKQAVKAEKA